VTLAGGEMIDAGIVAASCDPRRALIDLVEGGAIAPELEQRLAHYRTEGTTAQVNLALTGPLPFAGAPDRTWSRACLAATFDEMERAFDAVKYGRCSEHPIVELFCPTVEDPTTAPDGHAVVSATVRFVPYHLEEGWTDEQRQRLGDVVVETIARVAPAVSSLLVGREVLAPPDIEARFGVTHGHEFHGEHALDQLLARPTPETARYATPIGGLYLCGAGTHPGGGLTCAPGALGAAAILSG
jgi:phytoene dehydrogenase-like protein